MNDFRVFNFRDFNCCHHLILFNEDYILELTNLFCSWPEQRSSKLIIFLLKLLKNKIRNILQWNQENSCKYNVEICTWLSIIDWRDTVGQRDNGWQWQFPFLDPSCEGVMAWGTVVWCMLAWDGARLRLLRGCRLGGSWSWPSSPSSSSSTSLSSLSSCSAWSLTTSLVVWLAARGWRLM